MTVRLEEEIQLSWEERTQLQKVADPHMGLKVLSLGTMTAASLGERQHAPVAAGRPQSDTCACNSFLALAADGMRVRRRGRLRS